MKRVVLLVTTALIVSFSGEPEARPVCGPSACYVVTVKLTPYRRETPVREPQKVEIQHAGGVIGMSPGRGFRFTGTVQRARADQQKDWRIVLTYPDSDTDVIPIHFTRDTESIDISIVAADRTCNDDRRYWVIKDGSSRDEYISKYIIARQLAKEGNCQVLDNRRERSRDAAVLAWFSRSCSLAQNVENMRLDEEARRNLEKIARYRREAAVAPRCVLGGQA